MDRKKLVLLLGALVVAIGTALAARSMFVGAATPEVQAVVIAPETEGPKVLVAKRALPIGTILTTDSVDFQLWPKELVQDAYFLDGEADVEKLMGTVVRHPITAGQPVTQGTLVSPGDSGFLAAALGPGMRAITVPVSTRTSVGGFIFPGDRVDLMLTQTIKGVDNTSLKASETILRNLRVLATDRSTESTTNKNGKTVVRAIRNVTLEVTPRMAEKVTVAQQIGSLSLSLRSIADTPAQLERALAAGTIELPDGASRAEEERLLRTAVARPQEGPSSYVTGGDVSRFESTVMPRMGVDMADQVVRNGRGVPVAVRPVVRVTRGKSTSRESVDPGAGRLLDRQADGAAAIGRADVSTLH